MQETRICPECGCGGAHWCTGKPLPNGCEVPVFEKLDNEPLCGLGLTVEEKICQYLLDKT